MDAFATDRRARGDPVELERAVGRWLAGATRPGERITVALSGGLDSVVLAELLARLARPAGRALDAVHVHHGISPNADHWQAFARELCAEREIPFTAVEVRLGGRENLEARARELRYRALCAHPTDVIALAHHRDDQAETILLQLLRGAGLRGLAAMPSSRAGAGACPRIERPLLGVGRSELHRYAVAHRLEWIDDESNADIGLRRNFLRREVLPMLERRFPGAGAALARSAGHVCEAQRLLDQLAQIDASVVQVGTRLRIAELARLDVHRQRNLLRYFLVSVGARPPSAVRLDDALRQLTTARGDAQPAVPLGRFVLRRHRGCLEVDRREGGPIADAPVPWHGQPVLDLGIGRGRLMCEPTVDAGLSRARLAEAPVEVRLRRGGERMLLRPGGPRRALKNLLQEAAVPAWLRARLPLLFCGEELVWVAGVGSDVRYRAQLGEAGVDLRWLGPEDGVVDDGY